jgi:GGDEF domain-containing protein
LLLDGAVAALIHRADLAMYRAKRGGRGRIECFDVPSGR